MYRQQQNKWYPQRSLLAHFEDFSLAKLHHGGPSSLKVVKKLLDAGEISSDIISMTDEMYRQEQNKWYPQRSLLAHFEDTLDFSRSEFTCT